MIDNMLFFALLGAILGSFANVVIYRLPRMMHGEAFTLSWPPSFCPHCRQRIRKRYNVPLLGWLWLKGRSQCCRQPISWRYPGIEFIMALLFALLIGWQGVSAASLLDLSLLFLSVVMLFIDYDYLLLPDKLTLPFLGLAMLSAWAKQPDSAAISGIVAGAAMGFLIPWALNRLFLWRSGQAGIGAGDMKLFAGIGGWQGCEALFHIMLIASLLGLVYGYFIIKARRSEAFPFGPAIIIAAVGWLFGAMFSA